MPADGLILQHAICNEGWGLEMGSPEAWPARPLLPCLVLTQADSEDAKDADEFSRRLM